MKVFAVSYGNYYPTEVDSLWLTEDGANRRKDELHAIAKGDWRVIDMKVGP